MDHHHHTAPHAPHPSHTHDALPDLLDLDAQVVASSLDEVRADISRLVDAPLRTALDLGAGTGTGTFGLLAAYPDAHVIAVDGSRDMVDRLQRRAQHLGVADRVTAVTADLDEGVPQVPPVDLVWASAFLHHLADPDRTLRQLLSVVRPGGLLAVIELAGFPRFVADETPDGIAEANAHALLAADRATDMPTMGGDWAPRVTGAGFVLEIDRPILVDLQPPLPPMTGDYAFSSLLRMREAVVGRLGAADAERLDGLLNGGPGDVRRRRDLHVRTERRLLIARRPVAGANR